MPTEPGLAVLLWWGWRYSAAVAIRCRIPALEAGLALAAICARASASLLLVTALWTIREFMASLSAGVACIGKGLRWICCGGCGE